MLLLIDRADVLRVIARQDTKTLSNWYSIQSWFPAPALHGRPPRWDDGAVREWIDEWIPRLYEEGVAIPELRDAGSATRYARDCTERLNQVIAEIKAAEKQRVESLHRIQSILCIYRGEAKIA